MIEEKLEKNSSSKLYFGQPTVAKIWPRNVFIIVATAGLLIGGVAAAIHYGFIPAPTHLLHHFSIGKSTFEITLGLTGGAILLGGTTGAVVAQIKRRQFEKQLQLLSNVENPNHGHDHDPFV